MYIPVRELVMSVQVFCPKCDRSCRIKEELLGKRVRCPGCQEVFKAEEIPVAEIDESELDEVPEFSPSPSKSSHGEKGHSERRLPAIPGKSTTEENPFDDKSRLTPAGPVDVSAFEFDYGDEAETPKKKGDSDRPTKHSVDRKRSHRDDDDDSDSEERPQKKSTPVTEYAWDKKKKPPDELTSRTAIQALRDEKAKKPDSPPESPFAFNEEEEPPPAPSKRPGSRPSIDDEAADKPRRESHPKHAPINDDADYLGLRDLDDPAPATANPKPKKKSGARQYFHAKQTGFWSEVRLFRIFLHHDELVFVTAATGKEDVAEMEEVLETGSMDDCDHKIRNKLLDLDEFSVDQLADEDRHSFAYAGEKITSVTIDPAPRSLLRKHGPAILEIEHKSKGKMTFEFSTDDDVDRAIDFLPELVDEVLEINVRWDKAKECFVGR